MYDLKAEAMPLVFKPLAVSSKLSYLVLWCWHAESTAQRVRFTPLRSQELSVMSRSYNFRSRTRESLDAADMVEVAMRTHDHEVEARLLAAQDLTMDEVLQLQDWGVSLAVVRAAPSVDDDCQ